MRQRGLGVAAVAVVLAAAGCRTSVHEVRMERVDQELAGGNRGYLVGTPPPPADRGTPTRGITELEVQLPSGAKRTTSKRGAPRTAAPFTADMADADLLATEPAMEEALAPPAVSPLAPAPGTFEQYTVKKGDSLWKIAKQFYGDPYQWRRIYEANRDRLSDPNRVRRGMTLKIPTGGSSATRGQTRARTATQAASTESDLK